MNSNSSPPEPNSLIGQPILEGWMLKKKRKKMQGFARRYFYLTDQPATLSYSFSPQSRIRDSVYISLASISISRRSKSIHIDSGGSLVMHIKTLSDSDFVRWTNILKSLVTNGGVKEHERRQRRRKAAKKTKGSESSGGPCLGLGLNFADLNALRPLDMSTIYHSVSKMQAPLVALESIQAPLRDFLLAHPENASPPFSDSAASVAIVNYSNISPNSSTPKGKKPHLFRHHSHQSPHDGPKLMKTITDALSELRAVHLGLVDLLNAHSTSIKNQSTLSLTTPPIPRQGSDTFIKSGPAPPVPSQSGLTATSAKPPNRSLSIQRNGGGSVSPNERKPSPCPDLDAKSDSNDTESDLTFHDAASEEGGFVDLDAIHPGHAEETEFESFGTSGHGGAISSDDSETDSSSEADEPSHRRTDSVHTVKSLVNSQPLQLAQRHRHHHRPSVALTTQHVQRRTRLPAKVSGDEFSVFAMLRKNVGKDLSQVSFPISFNEPLSALQKLCEEVEYSDMLVTRAVASSDPIERLVFVSAFAVSAFCATKTRATRKPFNPILGETYECVRPDKGMKYVSEKVSHHPPIMAAYAEGDGWKFELTSSIRQKFWGKSLEVIREGLNRLTIYEGGATSGEPSGVFHWDKPSSFVRNLMSGTKYLEHIGKVTVSNDLGPEKATIEFKPGTTFGGEGSRNKVEIKVMDGDGEVQATVVGKWDSELVRSDTDELVFEANPMPERASDYYGFSKFAIELNEITEDLRPKSRLAPTDSRLRPDQRLMEEGKMDEAEVLKERLEERQRERRKKADHVPFWFEKSPGSEHWIYRGGYFENIEKSKPEWKESDLF
ncbi:uncharacterized protein MELLADRAFT_96141 [Melampsora larici-populina 98AG31]|uniref:PH domain-containing protein n=1 Tax=Melampsora larici-populina (strain 98AG31 / pathotype 3-4-7) TaxID=747676 RepID=F4SB43_MELLP|nr:uncharacterized protein MELLADRAFT_96141 [Melampsora larici-populina 98AG31]EGF98128.1 hypothetical protein MELLADRAFT_96141 [Melampsora larici-populina 98AG31]